MQDAKVEGQRVKQYLLASDDFEAELEIKSDGSVRERGAVLFNDPEFAARSFDEKIRLVKEGRRHADGERFRRRASAR